MKANPTRFWILVIALGWAFDFLFWEKSLGINFFLYVTFCLGGGAFLLQSDGLRLARRAEGIPKSGLSSPLLHPPPPAATMMI